jgi:molybdate transport system ATP-binding protein
LSNPAPSASIQRGPHHFVRLHHRLGALTLDAAFALSAPWTVLFGPSGSGKSSLLRAIAGLLRPEQASISRAEGPQLTPLTDTIKKVFVPPHQRSIRYAPQRASLFPHFTVRQNIAYGSADGDAVSQTLQLFQLEPLAGKRLATLSGGERQRVNLARAFAATECRLLLLDEPFAGLDHQLRDQLLPRLQTWAAERRVPILSVTHDVVEALQLRAEVITIKNGKVTTQGPAETILAAERQRLLAHLTV